MSRDRRGNGIQEVVSSILIGSTNPSRGYSTPFSDTFIRCFVAGSAQRRLIALGYPEDILS